MITDNSNTILDEIKASAEEVNLYKNDATAWNKLGEVFGDANDEGNGQEALQILCEFKDLKIPQEYDSRLVEIWLLAMAVSMDITNADYWGNLGVGLGNANMEDKSLEALQALWKFKELKIPQKDNLYLVETWLYAKAASLDMDNATAWYNLGVGLGTANYKDNGLEALQILSEFEELKIPQKDDTRLTEIWVKGKAVSKNVDDAEAWSSLSEVMGEADCEEEGLESLHMLLEFKELKNAS